eukprot:5512132-Ditylum_brightwellii.AAC.1
MERLQEFGVPYLHSCHNCQTLFRDGQTYHRGNQFYVSKDNTKTSKELNISCNPDIQPPICMHGQFMALANESATQDGERGLFIDELMAIESCVMPQKAV